jgi:amino acid permease
MKRKSKTLQIAVSLTGTIIGAGIFGLPAVFSTTGILGGTLLFVLILAVALILNQLYIDIIYSVRGAHRLPGYARILFGRKTYYAALISMVIKTSGTLLAYVILGGTFLYMLGTGLGIHYPLWVWAVLFWGFGSLVVFYGIKTVSAVEGELTWFLVGFMLFTALILFPFINWQGVATININGFLGSIGVIFFATTAMTVLPDLKEIAGRDQRKMRIGAAIAVLSAGFLSWLFGAIIASVYPHVKGVTDIQLAFPPIFWWLIPTIGLLAVSTSFLTFTQALKNLLAVDLKIKPIPAWIFSVVAPILLFALISQDFLKTVGFVGGVVTTFNGVLICILAYKVNNQPQKIHEWIMQWFRLSEKSATNYYWIWRYLPIPLSIVLMIIIVEQIIALL